MKTGKIRIPPGVLKKIKNLKYEHSPHIDIPITWKKYPKACLQHFEYGSKQGVLEWFKCFAPKKSNKVGFLFSKLDSGHMVPEHKDHFTNFAKFHKIKNKNSIKRRLVFVEDWKPGHYFQVGRVPFINWKSGDYVEWGKDEKHFGGNIGMSPRYVLQVTYTL